MPAPYTTFTFADAWYPLTISEGNIWTPSMLGLSFNNGVVGNSYAQQFTVAGYGGIAVCAGNAGPGAITVAVTAGALPPGLSLSYVGGFATWQISGTPTTAGTYNFTLTATGAYGSGSADFTIIVTGTAMGGAAWPGLSFPQGVVGIAYSEQFTPAGATPVTVTLQSGALPTGLSLSNVSGSTYQISGTPSATGTFSFTLRATNTYGTSDASYSIVVVSAGGGAFVFAS